MVGYKLSLSEKKLWNVLNNLYPHELYIIRCLKEECEGSVIPTDPLNKQSDWKCDKCQEIVPVQNIRSETLYIVRKCKFQV